MSSLSRAENWGRVELHGACNKKAVDVCLMFCVYPMSIVTGAKFTGV